MKKEKKIKEFPRLKNQLRIHWSLLLKKQKSWKEVYKILRAWLNTDKKLCQSSLLKSQKKELIEKIEKMKIEDSDEFEERTGFRSETCSVRIIYNEALEQILKILKED